MKLRFNKKIMSSVVSGVLVATMILASVFAGNSVQREKVGEQVVETNTGNMNIVPFNNPGLISDLDVGAASRTYVTDYNQDGYMDLLVNGSCLPYYGLFVFYGTADSRNEDSPNYMVMEQGLRLGDDMPDMGATYLYEDPDNYRTYYQTLVNAGWNYLGDLNNYPNLGSKWALGNEALSEIDGNAYTGKRWNESTMIDIDGDGIVDLVDNFSSWDEYLNGGVIQDSRWSDDGVWGDDNGDGVVDKNDQGVGDLDNGVTGDGDDDPMHGWVVWTKGTADYEQERYYDFKQNPTKALQVYEYTLDEDGTKIPNMDKHKALDVYGRPCAQFADWDRDGDMDLICGSFYGDMTYFENIRPKGELGEPILAVGRSIPMVGADDGKPVVDAYGNSIVLSADGSMMNLAMFDWNGDNYMDLIISEESGTVALAQHTGEVDENGTPIFVERVNFLAPADHLNVANDLITVRSADWDGDGDEDIIVGDTYGYISFLENLTIQIKDGVKYTNDGKKVADLSKKELSKRLSDPIWNRAVRLRNSSNNEVYRLIAGPNGSLQGPSEKRYGYVNISVADWDGDGILDIMSNSIRGEVWWHRGIAGDPCHVEDPRPVEVEWSEGAVKKPEWVWWEPNGNQLLTQWRTTPEMIDLPLSDTNGDGVAEGDGLMDLVMVDADGYLCLYERYRDTDNTLKLKEPERIFKLTNGADLKITLGGIEQPGRTGRTKFCLVDYDVDGDIDILKGAEENVVLLENVSTEPGKYVIQDSSTSLGDRNIADHAMSPAACDWDCNGVPDIIIGAMDGHIYYLKNTLFTNPDDHLMAQWDFEGEGDEVFEDKSWRVGNIKDTLYVVSSAAEVNAGKAQHTANASNYVTVENGVAKLTSGKGITSALMALNSDDLNPMNEMTIFFRAKFGEGTKAATALFDKGLQSRSYSLQLWRNTASNPITKFKAEVWAGGKRVVDSNITAASGVNHEWREYAMVISRDANGKLVTTLYVSNGESTTSGADFTELFTVTTNTTELLDVTTLPLLIGNDHSMKNDGFAREFDEIRIYDMALTTDQLAGLTNN